MKNRQSIGQAPMDCRFKQDACLNLKFMFTQIGVNINIFSPRQVHSSYCRICKTNELVVIITLGDTSKDEGPPENPSGQIFG